MTLIQRTIMISTVVCLAILGFSPHSAQGIAVMSVDLGSEWMKIGIVSPGVPMEIVLNKESKRKTPVAVSFRDNERLIGEDAVNVAVRFPSNAYLYFMDLLGKKMDNPIVELYQKRFPYYNLVQDPDRGTVLFQHDSETHYSPEELLGMVLSQARDYAQEFANQPVKDAVITVPPFFNQAERRAVMHAAELADIKVLQLMNTNTASALNYGIFRRKDFNDTPQHLLLYDMGSSSTVATIISYQETKTKEKGIVEKNPQLTILGVGYDRTLGGLEMQLRLRDFLGKAFNDLKKTQTDVFTNHRALAKLFKEAGRLKNVLSANTDHYAQVEGLLDEKDFKTAVSRDQFENLCGDLFDRVKAPVEQALKAAGMTMDLIDQVILVGAGTRVPKVQEKLTEVLKRELGKSLNTDEAAAMGAVYKAADLSSGFKVKKFVTKDAVLFPILVDFERELDAEEGTPKPVKIVRRTLFSHMNPYPQKKILTFNKHVNDFSFYVSYGELPVSAHEATAIGSANITKVDLKGVGSAIEKNTGEGIESKGVKAHFNLDENGIFSLTLVESVFEKNTSALEQPAPEEPDTLSKLGSAFSKLFSGSEEPSEPTEPKFPGENEESEKAGTEEPKEPQLPINETDGKSTEESATGDDKDKKESDGAKNDSKVPEKPATGTTAEADKKPKLIVIKEAIEVETSILDVLPLHGEKFQLSAEKLKKLAEIDQAKAQREKARNSLESFVSDMQHKAASSEFEKFLSEEEKEKISNFCSETSDWIYEDGFEAEKEVFEDKLKNLKFLSKDFMDRLREHKDRPDAMEALDQMLNMSTTFLDSSKKLPEDQQYFTEVELTTLDKAVKETLEWKAKMLEDQAAIPLSQAPVLTVRSIADKIDTLDREVKYMMNKARVEKLRKQREEATKLKEQEDKKAKEDVEKLVKKAKDSGKNVLDDIPSMTKEEIEKLIKEAKESGSTILGDVPPVTQDDPEEPLALEGLDDGVDEVESPVTEEEEKPEPTPTKAKEEGHTEL